MAWAVEFAHDAERDLSLIFDHLFATYKDLGDPVDLAFDRAGARVRGIRDSAIEFGSNPYRGTKRDTFGEGFRNITINQAVIWFHLDEAREVIKVLAFFFGGQDHIRHMLLRLLEG